MKGDAVAEAVPEAPGNASREEASRGAVGRAQVREEAAGRCLIVTSIFPPIHGGSAVVYENLARFAGGDVAVIAPYRHYQTGRVLVGWQDLDKASPFTVRRVELVRPPQRLHGSRMQSLRDYVVTDIPLKMRLLRAAAAVVRRERIQVVCIGELNSVSWIGPVLRLLFGCRIVNYIHGEEITTTSSFRFFGNSRERFLRRADAVVAVSDFTRKALIGLMGVDPAKIHVIHNGVDTGRFRQVERPAWLAEKYGIADQPVILSVGRLVERKGMDNVLRALPRVLKRHPDLVYMIVGDGRYRPELEKLVGELGLERHVRFCGSVPDEEIVQHYALSDLFVLPNRELADGDTEGFGLVFLEANACGKPVIGGRAGGVVEAVQDGENGLLVDGHDVEEIAGTIDRLLSDEALHGKLTRGGLAIAARADWSTRARQFRDLCLQLVHRR